MNKALQPLQKGATFGREGGEDTGLLCRGAVDDELQIVAIRPLPRGRSKGPGAPSSSSVCTLWAGKVIDAAGADPLGGAVREEAVGPAGCQNRRSDRCGLQRNLYGSWEFVGRIGAGRASWPWRQKPSTHSPLAATRGSYNHMIDVIRRTRLHVCAAAMVASVALAGCGDSPPDRAGTVGESSADTGESTQEDSSETEEVELDTVGRELTDEEAKAALPPIAALPTGWSVDPENTLNDDSESDAESEETIEPAKCQTIMDDLSEEQDQEPTGEASTTYTAGMLGPFLGVEINSFADEVPEDSFKKVLDALSTCPEITSTEDGTTTTFKISSLSFPNLGEESAAIRMAGESEGMAVGLDMVVIRAGHNIVTLSQATVGGATGSGDALEKVARATVTNMESK